ncbi:MAG: hypothetical protein ABEI74_04485 [Candidatus Pacearchaeota archaeon]
MDLKQELQQSLKNIRDAGVKRNFDQTVELILNLQKLEVKKTSLNTFIHLPYKIKDKKVAGFLESNSGVVDTILPSSFDQYKDKKKLKDVEKKYDFFISQGSVMPKVAATFGKVLGPAGKMPSPKLGLISNADDKTVKEVKERIDSSVKIDLKEKSIKVPVGKESMEDEKVIENAMAVYSEIEKLLPRGKDNVKNVELKFTMTKPQKIIMK